MLDRFRGCMLGAAVGDALGMPGETSPMNLSHLYRGYRKAWRWHPNARLEPGQYTDDTQIMLLVASLLVSGEYSEERYARDLARLCAESDLRFPDGSVMAACERLVTQGPGQTGVNSDTAGCIPLAVPFALRYDDPVERSSRLAKACAVTHTHPAALAGAVTVACLLSATVYGAPDPIALALKTAGTEDTELGARIRRAIALQEEGISLEAALPVIGNNVSVYHTVPIAFFLMGRYEVPENLLYVAANVGGNTDTIAFICGAYAGARYGAAALPADLLAGLENRDQIDSLARALFDATTHP
ncbi:ADP-ribosylglycohydrolase family protein [Methanoculleus sp. 7T]|uniref:ADP-ribosylglycohydrolase family protein n=1 Tax=Methanoculleus sp. 7T TaxID=2937282 RepID=UPI0020BF3EAB|nr:ADP-ribosylglycohydrolase family protein [Methanoculleus sp. 7T]MCK8519895.1 ADP-ribosylglycohydrolase family protein [Methanoculleus sp. 7T]